MLCCSSKGRLLVFQLETKHAAVNARGYLSSTTTPTSSTHPTPGSSSADAMVVSETSVTAEESDIADGEVRELRLQSHVVLPGVVLSVTSYLGQYVLASAGNYVRPNWFSRRRMSNIPRSSNNRSYF